MRSSSAAPVLRTDLQDGVLTLAVDCPDEPNALDPELKAALAAAIGHAAVTEDVRGLVITGHAGAFGPGGSLSGFGEIYAVHGERQPAHRSTDLIEALERLEKPAVAAVDGVVTGVGLALILACDWRAGSPRARIRFREGRIGLVAAHGGASRLVRLVGLARARELLLGGEELEAPAAAASGLLTEIVPAGESPVAHARDRVHRMLGRAPLSFAAIKRLLQLAAEGDPPGEDLRRDMWHDLAAVANRPDP